MLKSSLKHIKTKSFFTPVVLAAVAVIIGISCFTQYNNFFRAHMVSGEEAVTTIEIQPDSVLGNVNPLLFGGAIVHSKPDPSSFNSYSDTGAGVWDSEKKIPVPQMVTLAKNIGTTVLRWGNGSTIHVIDWKKNIGPIYDSGGTQIRQKFGLPEFLEFSTAVGATPIVEVSDYMGDAADAANLVQYLNGPIDSGHPWAQKRAADGHPDPWNVIYFEYGNETYAPAQAPDGKSPITKEQYAQNYFSYQAAMKAVDSRVQLGAVCGFHVTAWSSALLSAEKSRGIRIDFLVNHMYLPTYNTSKDPTLPVLDLPSLFGPSMAAGSEAQYELDRMNSLSKQITGRYIPIAITEFNGGFIQPSGDKPMYRHTLGNALVNADLFQTIMQPKNNVFLASFWQYANSYFGQVNSSSGSFVKRPQYYPFEFYYNHFGNTLVNVSVNGPNYTVKDALLYNRQYTITYLSVNASKNSDGSKLYLMITNKNLDNAMTANINLGSFNAGNANIYTLSGPTIDAVNEKVANNVTAIETSKEINATSFSYEFAPHSLTAIEINRFSASPSDTSPTTDSSTTNSPTTNATTSTTGDPTATTSLSSMVDPSNPTSLTNGQSASSKKIFYIAIPAGVLTLGGISYGYIWFRKRRRLSNLKFDLPSPVPTKPIPIPNSFEPVVIQPTIQQNATNTISQTTNLM
jgi:alpha-L-arabinofuranosidase